MIAVLGAGLAGLSASYHLKQSHQLIEKAPAAGGLARSFSRDGFSFDQTGHLLHFKDVAIKKLVTEDLALPLVEYERNAQIYLQGRYIPYPFQQNLHALPDEIKTRCLEGLKGLRPRPKEEQPAHFLAWCEESFGRGITDAFMKPYNEKLWCVPLDTLSCEWMGRYVPRPDTRAMIRSAEKNPSDEIGYNATFYYPAAGGINALPQKFVEKLSSIQYNQTPDRLDLKEKTLHIRGRKPMAYDTLISSIPLPELLKLIKDLPDSIRQAANEFQWTGVYNFNFGTAQKPPHDAMWVYYPEKKLPFYRVGCYTHIQKTLSPPDTYGYYAEAAFTGDTPDLNLLKTRIIEGLIQVNLIRSPDDIMTAHENHIRYAYVIYDQNRKNALETVQEWLRRHDVHLIGRYGKWEYGTMESAITDGREIAASLNRDAS